MNIYMYMDIYFVWTYAFHCLGEYLGMEWLDMINVYLTF